MLTSRTSRLPGKCSLLLSFAAVTAAAGTVSPQLTAMPPNQPVQVIVEYAPGLLGGAVVDRVRGIEPDLAASGWRIVLHDRIRRDQSGAESHCGSRLNVVTLDFGALVERTSRTSQYEACLLGFTHMAVDPIDQMNVWLSSGPQHAWWPSQKSPSTEWEARIDRLVLAQASEPSRDLRRKAFSEVQRILVEQEPMIYLVNPDALSALFPQSLANVESLRFE